MKNAAVASRAVVVEGQAVDIVPQALAPLDSRAASIAPQTAPILTGGVGIVPLACNHRQRFAFEANFV